MVKLAASMAWIKQRTEEYRILLRRTSVEGRMMESLREIFFKQTEYIYSTFDVGRSMFDVHQFLFRLNWSPFRPAAGLTPDT